MWVRAVPQGDHVELSIEQWHARPSSSARLSTTAGEAAAPELLEWAVDDQLRVISLSPALADALGVSAAGVSGQPVTRTVKLEENDEGEMPMLTALSRREEFSGQLVRSRADDRTFVLSGRPVFGPSGDFAGFEGKADAGEQPSPPAACEPDDAELGEVLRSPLDRIIDAAGRIADRSEGPLRNEYAVYAADISAAAHHLLSIVHSMGHESGSGQARLDLVELTNEALALVESASVERDIALAIEPVDSCLGRGERRGVVQILVNLIGNAVRYSPPGAAVSVSFERADRTVFVHVADNGPGIDPADQERIFERFEQAATGGEGTGLGLAIARRLAQAMGGDIRLRSQPGSGSTFSLALPAA